MKALKQRLNLRSKTAAGILLLLIFLLVVSNIAAEVNGLFFGEAQAVAGYSGMTNSAVWYSFMPEDFMQKPSLGIDTTWRFSADTGDWLILSLQARAAYDNTSAVFIKAQVYNAYAKLKLPFGDVWFGHNRIASGLFSYYDTHGLLLPASPMFGYGLDRDWGIGWQKNFDAFDLSASISLGSGAAFLFSGNFLGAVRLGIGDRNQDNWTAGCSLMGGYLPLSHGWTATQPLQNVFMAGIDWNWFIDSWEFALDSFIGLKDSQTAAFGLLRIGWDLLGDKLLKPEVQTVIKWENQKLEAWAFTGISSQITASFALRGFASYSYPDAFWQFALQAYFYSALF